MREDGGGGGREKERMKEGEEEEEGEVEVEVEEKVEGEGEKEDDGADCGEAVLPVLNPESSGQAPVSLPSPSLPLSLSLSPSPSPSLSPHPGSLSHAREPRVALPRDGAVIHSSTEAAATSVTPSFRHLGRAGQSRLSRAGQSPRGRGWDACDVIARWPRRSTPNTSGALHTTYCHARCPPSLHPFISRSASSGTCSQQPEVCCDCQPGSKRSASLVQN